MPSAVTHDIIRDEHFKALYKCYKDMIRKRIEFCLHGSLDIVEEVEQEAWLKIWQNIKPGKVLKAGYLSMIATSVTYDALRHKYRAGNQSIRTPRPLPLSLDADWGTYEEIEGGSSVEQHIFTVEEIEEMIGQIQNERHREICLLRLVGFSYKELAQRFHYSIGNISDILEKLHERSRKARAEALI